MKAAHVLAGADDNLTLAYYLLLQKRGPLGMIALNLFRAQKNASSLCRPAGYGPAAAAAASAGVWSLELLVHVLARHGAHFGISYGWKPIMEPRKDRAPFVLFVDLPDFGQVSFDAFERGCGPEYSNECDGVRKNEERIFGFCDFVYAQPAEVS